VTLTPAIDAALELVTVNVYCTSCPAVTGSGVAVIDVTSGWCTRREYAVHGVVDARLFASPHTRPASSTCPYGHDVRNAGRVGTGVRRHTVLVPKPSGVEHNESGYSL